MRVGIAYELVPERRIAFGPRTIRVVTRLDVSREQCERAAKILVEIAEGKAA